MKVFVKELKNKLKTQSWKNIIKCSKGIKRKYVREKTRKLENQSNMSNIWIADNTEREKRKKMRSGIHQRNKPRKFPRIQRLELPDPSRAQWKWMKTDPHQITLLWNSEPSGQMEDSICFLRGKNWSVRWWGACPPVSCLQALTQSHSSVRGNGEHPSPLN